MLRTSLIVAALLTMVGIAVVWASSTSSLWEPTVGGGVTKTTITTFTDTWLEEAATTTTHGSDTIMTVNTVAVGIGANALMRPDLSGLPSGEPIIAAHLTVTMKKGALTGSSFNARRVVKNWVEGEATWKIAKTGTNWGITGALKQGERLGPSDALDDLIGESSTFDVMAKPWTVQIQDDDSWAAGDVITMDVTDLVRAWVDGDWSNYGVSMTAEDTTTGGLVQIYSSNATAKGPSLDVWTATPDKRAPPSRIFGPSNQGVRTP